MTSKKKLFQSGNEFKETKNVFEWAKSHGRKKIRILLDQALNFHSKNPFFWHFCSKEIKKMNEERGIDTILG